MPRELQLAGRMRGALRTLVPAGLKIAHSYGLDFKPLQRDGFTAQCHRDWPDDPRFIPQWNMLLERNPESTVFCSPIWQSAVVKEFVRAGQFRLITVYRGSDLLAVLPLALDAASMLESPGQMVSDYLSPLIDSAHAGEIWSIIFALIADLWDWSVGGVVLHNIQANASIREILPLAAAQAGWDYEEKIITQALFIPLPATWEEYLAGLDSHERKETKRKVRNAETKGNSRWLTITQESDLRPALDRALVHMQECQTPKGDFTRDVLVAYLRRVCPQLAGQGQFFMKELWIENKPCAWLLALNSPRGPMIYNTGYDPAMRHWSPGMVSFALAIQDAITAGHPIFNLLRGGETYKKKLGAAELQLYRITLAPVS